MIISVESNINEGVIMQVILNKLNEILSHIKDKDSSKYIDINEVSELCSVSRATIYRNVKKNQLKASDTTGKLLFKVEEVERWLNN
jgi:excisionase family DNA binding protein